MSFLQNHDQVANSTTGRRLQQLTSPGRARAMTALWLLMPGTPMLFQGQEFFASTPFLYFADHVPEIATAVRDGRRKSLQQFASATDPSAAASLPAPDDPATFAACRLDWDEASRNAPALAMHRDLIRLRREAPFSGQRPGGLDGAVLGPEAFVLRFFGEAGDDRLLVVNLGPDLAAASLAEPLVAPPAEADGWRVLWSSEDPTYGGGGTPPVEADEGWYLPGHAAVVLAPARAD